MRNILLQNTFVTVFFFVALLIIFSGSITPAFAKESKNKEYSHHKEKKFERIDTNSDGVISHEEFLANAERRFKKRDADGDGKITKEESKAHHAAMREKYKKHH